MAIAAVCDRVFLMSVMVSHGERCDGNCRGVQNRFSDGDVKSMHSSEQWVHEVRTEQPHVDSEQVEGENAIEEKLLLLQTMKC